jgi:hypothetical protein
MLVAVGSLKASPGATTFALALAACWPAGTERVLVECDPSGGDLAARYQLPPAPGLISLAAAGRHTPDPDVIGQHVQRLPGGLGVVLAPPHAGQARAAVEMLAGTDGGVLAATRGLPGMVVLADCGRLEAGSPLRPVLAAADRLLLLVRPRGDELAHLAGQLDELTGWTPRVGLLLAGTGYPLGEISAELGAPILASIPHDPHGAAGRSSPRRHPARLTLGRAATHVAATVAERIAAEALQNIAPTPVTPASTGPAGLAFADRRWP